MISRKVKEAIAVITICLIVGSAVTIFSPVGHTDELSQLQNQVFVNYIGPAWESAWSYANEQNSYFDNYDLFCMTFTSILYSYYLNAPGDVGWVNEPYQGAMVSYIQGSHWEKANEYCPDGGWYDGSKLGSHTW